MGSAKQNGEVRVVLPDEPPAVTDAVARALLRIIRRARVANRGESSSTRSE
jgi:hypothetical protein